MTKGFIRLKQLLEIFFYSFLAKCMYLIKFSSHLFLSFSYL